MLDYASTAVDLAEKKLSDAGRPFDADGHRLTVERARSEVRALEPAEERRAAFRPIEEQYARRKRVRDSVAEVYEEPNHRSPSLIKVEFPWSTQAKLDRLFELERTIDGALKSAGFGEVDGNEIGAGSFTLFIAPRRGKKVGALKLVRDLASNKV
jgi:hypothetical protein